MRGPSEAKRTELWPRLNAAAAAQMPHRDARDPFWQGFGVDTTALGSLDRGDGESGHDVKARNKSAIVTPGGVRPAPSAGAVLASLLRAGLLLLLLRL